MSVAEAASKVMGLEEAVDLKKLKKEYDKNEDKNYHSENYLLLAKAFGTPAEVKKVEEILKRNKAQGSTSKADNDWMYKNINKYYDKIRTEEVEVAEAVLADRDYEYDGKVIKISKKNFSKVPNDYKNSTKGKERMITYDDKAGTVSVPVEFTEEVEVDENFAVLNEALKPRDKAVIDAFYSRKGNLASNLLSVEGGKLTKMGMGGQEIAIWKNDKIVINAKMDVKSTEEIVRYMKKSIPSGVFEEVEIEEEFWAVIDKAKGGEVMAVSSDEKGAKSSVKMSNFSKHDYHFGKDPRTLKIVKVAGSYKQGEKMIGTKLSFKEEVEITEAVHDKKSTFTMAPFEDLRSVADAALKIMTRQPQEVKEEEKEEVTKEDQPQSLTEEIV
jgi:hypothetical protein